MANADVWYPTGSPQRLTPVVPTWGVQIPSITGTQCLHVTGTGQISGTGADCGTGVASNFLTNVSSNTFLNTGTVLQAPNLQATSTTGINYFLSNTAVGTTTPRFPFQIASSTGNTTGGAGQLMLTDTNAGANLKHWLFTSESGNMYIGSVTDLFATTTTPILTMTSTGRLGISSTNPVSTFEAATTNFRLVAASEAGVNTRGINMTAGTVGNTSNISTFNNGVFDFRAIPTTSGVITAQMELQPFGGINFASSVSPAGLTTKMQISAGNLITIQTPLDITGKTEIGTTTAPWWFDVAANSTTASSFLGGQFVLTDLNAGTNLKHFQQTYESGNFYMGQATDLFASTSPYFTILNGGKTGISTSTPYATFSVQSGTATGDAFAVATSSASAVMGVDNQGHEWTSGYAPVVSSCGTGSPSVVGDDEGGTITTGTAATSCTLTFSSAYRYTPYMAGLSDNSATIVPSVTSISTTTVTFALGAGLSGGQVYYSIKYHQ